MPTGQAALIQVAPAHQSHISALTKLKNTSDRREGAEATSLPSYRPHTNGIRALEPLFRSQTDLETYYLLFGVHYKILCFIELERV